MSWGGAYDIFRCFFNRRGFGLRYCPGTDDIWEGVKPVLITLAKVEAKTVEAKREL